MSPVLLFATIPQHLMVIPNHLSLPQVEEHSLKVYLADFRLAKVMSGSRLFSTAMMMSGTPGFQSPKQLRGENMHVGPASDEYAVGAVLIELFLGKPVWSKVNNFTIINLVANKMMMPDIDHLPPVIHNIVSVCVCPAAKQASAATILSMLYELF